MKRVVPALLALFLLINFASAFHSASEVTINLGGSDRDLQSTVDNNLYLLTSTSRSVSAISSVPVGNQPANQIWISIGDGGEMTLSSALSQNKALYGGATTYGSSPPPQSHLATQIFFQNGKSLQQAIIDGDLCQAKTCQQLLTSECYDATTINNGCGVNINCPKEDCSSGICSSSGVCTSCTPGATDSRACTNPNTICNPRDSATETRTCNSEGEWGSWSGCTNTPANRGIDCDGSATDYKACDGAGSCLGESGTGCAAETPVFKFKSYSPALRYNVYYDITNHFVAKWDDGSGWTSYSTNDPRCGRYKVFGGINNYDWKIMPAPCSPICPGPGSVACGTTDTRDNQCGENCNVVGVKCSGSEICVAGSCCDIDCPSPSDYLCEEWSPSGIPDGCGGTCGRVRGTALNEDQCPSTSSRSCGTSLGNDNCGNFCGYGSDCGGGLTCDYVRGSWACCPGGGMPCIT